MSAFGGGEARSTGSSAHATRPWPRRWPRDSTRSTAAMGGGGELLAWGERGVVDLLAWHAERGCLLVIELGRRRSWISAALLAGRPTSRGRPGQADGAASAGLVDPGPGRASGSARSLRRRVGGSGDVACWVRVAHIVEPGAPARYRARTARDVPARWPADGSVARRPVAPVMGLSFRPRRARGDDISRHGRAALLVVELSRDARPGRRAQVAARPPSSASSRRCQVRRVGLLAAGHNRRQRTSPGIMPRRTTAARGRVARDPGGAGMGAGAARGCFPPAGAGIRQHARDVAGPGADRARDGDPGQAETRKPRLSRPIRGGSSPRRGADAGQ